MAGKIDQSQRRAWGIVARQHGVISRRQLLALGFTRHGIAQRLASRRLHRLHYGVYAVGRPEVSAHGCWLAAVLACGNAAALSHLSAAHLWGIVSRTDLEIDVVVPDTVRVRRPGIRVHRRSAFAASEVTRRHGIPVTRPAATIVDIALGLAENKLERAINEADQQGVVRFDALRGQLERMPARPGRGRVRRLVLRHSFRLTRSELERLFLPIARRARLPVPETRALVAGFEVDFWFPELGLVVEADSLTYHRTPAKQARDRLRDQTHMARGLWPLRFTHWQIAHDRRYVERILRDVAARLRRERQDAA